MHHARSHAGSTRTAVVLAAHAPGSATGSGVRNELVVDVLRSRCETVDVVALAPAELGRWSTAASLLRGGVFYAPERAVRLSRRLECLTESGALRPGYDLLWCHQSLMANAALRAIEARDRVLDVDTVAGPVMRASAQRGDHAGLAGRVKRLYARAHASTALREEARRARSFDRVVVASSGEREILAHRGVRAEVVPNAVPPPPPVHEPERSDVLFVGSLDYGPNIEAVRLLLEKVLPRLRAARPRLKVAVAGRSPTREVRDLCERYAASLIADAPSLAPRYAGASVFVAPLPYGGGTKIKVLEAMSHGLPMVLSEPAADGIGLENGDTALIRTRPAEIADAALELLGDERFARRLGIAAKRVWRQDHHPEAVHRRLAELLDDVEAELPPHA
jgi:glycosyltransferase involved in cell wall biosynthesis